MPEKPTLENTQTRWTHFFIGLFHKKALVLCLFFFSSLILLFLTVRIHLKADILDMLPSGDPVVDDYKLIQTGFKQLDLMLIDIGPRDSRKTVSDIDLTSVADQLSTLLRRSKLFDQVQGKISPGDIEQALELLALHRGNLFTVEDQNLLQNKLTPAAIRESLSHWKRQLLETPAPYLAQMFSRDPLNIDEMLLRKLSFTGISANKLKMRNGWMFTYDLQHILIVSEPRYHAGNEQRTDELIEFMTSAIRQSEAAAEKRDVRIAYIANHRFTRINAGMLRSDIKRTMALSLLAISIMVILVFRRPALFVVFTLLPAFYGGLFATALTVLFFRDVSAISLGCGAMLMGIVVDFSIHILYHLDQNETCTQEIVIQTLSELAMPILVTSGTTLIAFMALMLSVLPGYVQIGTFSSLGIVGSLLFSILGLPLLIPHLKPRKEPIVAMHKIYLPFFRWSRENRKFIRFFLILMTLLAGLGVARLEFDGDVRNLNASTPSIDRDVSDIMQTYGDPTMETSVVVKGSTRDEAMMHNDLLFRELTVLQERGAIRFVSSIAPIVPSQAVQRENLERWRSFWNQERVGRLKNDLNAVSVEMRLDPARLAHFLDGIQDTTTPLTVEDLEAGPLTRALSTRVSSIQEGFMVLSSFEPANRDSAKQVLPLLKSRIPGIVAANGQSLVARMVQLVKQEMTKLGSITLFFVALAMISYAKRPTEFLRLILPLLVSLFWTFGIMGWLGIKLNIVNDMVVVFVFGLVDDYCLFLHTAWRKFLEGVPEFLTQTSGAITVSAATTILGALALTFARHPALHSMGTTALLGISMGLVASFLIIPHSRS